MKDSGFFNKFQKFLLRIIILLIIVLYGLMVYQYFVSWQIKRQVIKNEDNIKMDIRGNIRNDSFHKIELRKLDSLLKPRK